MLRCKTTIGALLGGCIGAGIGFAIVLALFGTGVMVPHFGGLFGEGVKAPTDMRVVAILAASALIGAAVVGLAVGGTGGGSRR